VIETNKYPAQVFFSEEDEGFIAIAPDLPGCSAFGATQEEALAELQVAIDVWRGAAAKAGNPIPLPSKPQADPLPSGKVLVRMPRSLHGQLIERAKAEDVSLNQLVVHLLSGVVSVQATANEAGNVTAYVTAYGRISGGGEIRFTDPTTNIIQTMAQVTQRSLIVDFHAIEPRTRRVVERVKHG
jgi:predicted RNase H-like HicB family nuclease